MEWLSIDWRLEPQTQSQPAQPRGGQTTSRSEGITDKSARTRVQCDVFEGGEGNILEQAVMRSQ